MKVSPAQGLAITVFVSYSVDNLNQFLKLAGKSGKRILDKHKGELSAQDQTTSPDISDSHGK
ncbi:MAG: hypothetical protein GY703_08890 [Gammaproteobacteria bacterium]|nr:hypothetical protein [Gammaproteobacteria bacterium]